MLLIKTGLGWTFKDVKNVKNNNNAVRPTASLDIHPLWVTPAECETEIEKQWFCYTLLYIDFSISDIYSENTKGMEPRLADCACDKKKEVFELEILELYTSITSV